MATNNPYDLHTRAGVRWLAPMLLVLLAIIAGITLTIAYPHLTG